MKITECYGLPFVTIVIEFRGQRLRLDNVLIDTGSASTLLNADIVRDIGIIPEKDDIVDMIRGVGGVEYVYTKIVTSIAIGEQSLKTFKLKLETWIMGLKCKG